MQVKKKKKIKKIIPLTEQERQKIITNIMLEWSMKDIPNVINDEIKKHLDDYVKNGTTKDMIMVLDRFDHDLVLHLFNDRNIKSYFCFKAKKDKC